jgi:regulator of replication initiation timing
MNIEEWYAKIGEWMEENTALNMSDAAQRHLAKHLEEWQNAEQHASRPTECPECDGEGRTYEGDGYYRCEACYGTGKLQ